MSKHPRVAIDRRIGKTIRLDGITVPDILGFGAFLVAPDADERAPLTLKSTDRDDLILISGSNWRDTIMIDGGDGVNVIQGTFGFHDPFAPLKPNFTPTVRNVQWALLRSVTSKTALDFSDWTGLTYVEAHGQNGPFSQNSQDQFDDNIVTRFTNIPLTVTQLGVTNFNGNAVFEFAPPAPNSLSMRTVDLFLDSNALKGEIYIDSASVLHIHATGTNGPRVLHADFTNMIKVDGNGDVALQHTSSLAT
jgi:hypothetical protein